MVDTTGSKVAVGKKQEKRLFDVQRIRQDFPILSQQMRNKPLVYLDNAATTQKPRQVIEKLIEFYQTYNANVHRAIYEMGERATQEYELARGKVASFINAQTPHSIVFTRGATEAINLVAYSWGRHNLDAGDEILITEMEHHSNIIPWQLTARGTGATLRYIPIDNDGILDLSNPERYFTKHTKLVCIIHQSNVFGTVNPVNRIIDYAKAVNSLVLVDGAQSVPHFNVDVQEMGCDFLAFSGHKMVGPTGVGVLYGKSSLLDGMEPFMGGGEMIRTVTMEQASWNDIPWKFEAGTPNIAQAIGLGAAVDYLNEIGMEKIHEYDQDLMAHALGVVKELREVRIYGNPPHRGAVISFNVEGIHPHDLAQLLDQEGVAIRAGHHCAQPVMQKLGVTATARASFYFYNTKEEIDHFCESIKKAISFLKG